MTNPDLSARLAQHMSDLNSIESLKEFFEALCERFSFQHITYFWNGSRS